MNLLSGIIWHLATGHGQLYQLQRSDPNVPFNLDERIIKKTLSEHIRTARYMVTSAINPVLARPGLKIEQRAFEVLSKEECSKTKQKIYSNTFQSAPQYQLFSVWLVLCRLCQSH